MTQRPPGGTPQSPRDRIEALARSDKWYLGGLDGVVWAPPFPRWLHRPGFWDPVHLLHYEVGPCFSVALLEGGGAEIRMAAAGRGDSATPRWRPGRLTTTWRTGSGGNRPSARVATEQRKVLGGGTLESAWTLAPDVPDGWLVAYTAQPAGSVSGLRATEAGVTWTRSVTDRKGHTLSVGMEFSGSSRAAWRWVLPSEGAATPVWPLSPFAEGDDPSVRPGDKVGWVWVAIAFPASADGRLAFRMRLTPELNEPVWRDAEEALDWETFFDGFPSFVSNDAYLDRYFDYRIHGLGLNRFDGRWGNVRRPAITEGPEYFHVPITYSAQCHMMEMRWREGGSEAWGSILNFLDNQKEDGSLHGRLYPNHLAGTDFYHANWGDAVLAVHHVHPDATALERCYEGLSRYARWLNTARDPEESGMFTVVNHFETGQEYMSRYMAVDAAADVSGWRPRLRLKGIDVTVYAHQLFKALAKISRELGRHGDEPAWRSLADRSGAAISGHMWSPEARLFTDVDGRTLTRTGVKAAVGFYPMLTELVDDARLDAMMDHLEDPATFGTRFPLPSSSVDDPRFSAEGLWKGKRRNCPWNGRVWPMTTSHVIEGLLRHWRRGNSRAGALAGDMLVRFVRMMFSGGDLRRPNCYEHYNPHTGRACYFRGINDYQHSWVLDLIARGIAGLHVDEGGLEVWPLPHGLARVSMGPVRTRGRAVSVELDGPRVTLVVDGGRYDGPRGQPLRVGWADIRP